MNRRVVAALLRKELLDVARNRGALLPVVLVTALALIVPFIVTIVIPTVIGGFRAHGGNASVMNLDRYDLA